VGGKPMLLVRGAGFFVLTDGALRPFDCAGEAATL